MAHYLGVEIGGTKLQVVAGDEAGRIRERRRAAVDAAGGAKAIRTQLEGWLPGLVEKVRPRAIGVGFGGPVSWQTGRVCCSHQVGGWAEFALAEWLQALSGTPVCVDNDANVGTLGEALHGAGAGRDPVFYVTLGSGVGGGLVCRGTIYHGAAPGEAEIGHVRLDRTGVIVEQRCSGWAVDAKIRDLKRTTPDSALNPMTGSAVGGEARYLAGAVQAGDAAARRILEETAADLAFGLSHVVHLLHPEIIILGGGLALVGESLRRAVADALVPCVMEAFRPGPAVALAALGEDAVPVGALVLARQLGVPNSDSG